MVSYPMVTVFKCDTKVSTRTFIPRVIEPSFGIGRIITSLLEHNYYLRDDGLRRVLRLKPFLAPYKVVLLKLYSKLIPDEIYNQIRKLLKHAKIEHLCDDSAVTIGKRYSRSDEIGIPFAITLDTETVDKGLVTLRERDSLSQLRLSIKDCIKEIKAILNNEETWNSISKKYHSVQIDAEGDNQ